MSGKKRSGGRVTPKGTQPAGSKGHESGERTAPLRGAPEPKGVPGRGSGAPGGPNRAGPRGGNR